MSDEVKPTWTSDCGTVKLWLGDCLDVLPTLSGVDAVVTDPPYGIGEDGGACRTRSKPGYSKHEAMNWDRETPPQEAFDAMVACSRKQIIWGGNYFSDKLPPTQGWLYWRKLMGGHFADGELAWTSLNRALREYTKCPKGMDKRHPCEKPVELLLWCLCFVADATVICDPYLGSGTTGVACVRTGRRFLGIEKEPKYFEIAKRRILDELTRKSGDYHKQPDKYPLLAKGGDYAG